MEDISILIKPDPFDLEVDKVKGSVLEVKPEELEENDRLDYLYDLVERLEYRVVELETRLRDLELKSL